MKGVFIALLVICLISSVEAKDPTVRDDADPSISGRVAGQPLDIAVVKIQSEIARGFLKSDSIRVRHPHTPYLPTGTLAVLKTKRPTEEDCRNRLSQVLEMHGGRKPDHIEKIGGAFSTQLSDASCWIHPASGGYKFTATRASMSKPTRFKDFKEAVQACLDFIGRHKLVDLTQNEEIDIVTISAVNNVLSHVEHPERPEENFVSDYYISFGRRFRGVPIVGSYLTIRIDGEGEVAMVSKNWRPIIAADEEKARISEKPLQEIIFNAPDFREAYGSQKVGPENIHIAEIRAGYIEAPFHFNQEKFRPGCLVSFWVGDTRDETDAQLLLSLEVEGSSESLLGRPWR